MGLMSSSHGAGGRGMVEMFPLICHSRIIAGATKLLFRFAFVDIQMGVSAKLQQSAELSSRLWMETESLNQS